MRLFCLAISTENLEQRVCPCLHTVQFYSRTACLNFHAHVFMFLCDSLRPPRTLCNARRLSVCLLATLRKTTERIFTKILPQMYLWSRENWLNLGSHLPPDHPDSGFFEGFFSIARFCIFPQYGWCLRRERLFSLRFYHRCIRGRRSIPVKHWT